MKIAYCSNCGRRLPVFRKALPNYGRILDLIEPHVCSGEPEPFDIAPVEIPLSEPKESNKFVKKLNELPKMPPFIPEPLDHRSTEFARKEKSSTAPRSLLNMINTQSDAGVPNASEDRTTKDSED